MLISIGEMEIIKNYLKYSLWLVLTVFVALFGLHWLPAITDLDGLDVKLLLDPYVIALPRNGVTLRMRKL